MLIFELYHTSQCSEHIQLCLIYQTLDCFDHLTHMFFVYEKYLHRLL